MDLVKSGRAHEKSGNLKEALADFQKAQEVLNNPRLAQKIEELKQKIAAAEKTEKESKQQTPAPTSTPSDSSFEDSKKAEGQAESNPKVDKATEKAMALVKVAREKEKKFDIAGALADYRAANQVLKNPRLDEKIRKLENMLAESNKATPEASATKQDSSTPPDQPKLTNTKAADPQQGAEHKTKTASGEPNWITISGTRVSNNTQQVITFASLNIENADGIMLYISEASEMTAKGQNDSARVGEVEFYRKDGQKINPHQVLAESNIGYGFSAKQAIDGIRNYQYMSQGAQGWASVAKQPKASTWLDFRFPIETDVNKIVITTAPSRPYQLSSFELRAFAWREMRLSVGSETTQTSSLANSSTAAPKAVKAKPKNAAPKKVQAKRRVAKVPASKPKDAAITAWAGTFRAQENDGHTATTLTMKLNQQGNSIRGTVTARIVVQGKLFGEETSNVNGSISGNSGKLQFNDDNVKITLSKDGNTIRMAPPDQSESLAFKRITKAKKKNTDNKSAMDRVLGLSE
jgi:tetratricopeptide (TPR) repeat protein